MLRVKIFYERGVIDRFLKKINEYFHINLFKQAKEDNMYTLPRTPEIMLDDVENFCSASQMRKSHSIDTSYLYEESPSFHEAVNSKVHASRSTIRPPHGSSNLCKSKSDFNLSYVSGPRSVRSGIG